MEYIGFRPIRSDEQAATIYPGWNVYEYRDGEDFVLLPSAPDWPEGFADYGDAGFRERMAAESLAKARSQSH